MSTREELESKSRAIYRLFFGCLPISFQQLEGAGDVSAKKLQDRLHALFIPQGLVSAVHKESEPVGMKRLAVARGISLKPPLREYREIVSLDMPVEVDLEYSSESLDPEYYDLHKVKLQIRAKLFYDGFIYMIAVEEGPAKRFNYRRHVTHIQEWIAGLIAREEGMTATHGYPSPLHGSIRMYLLSEPIEEVEEDRGRPVYVKVGGQRAQLDFGYEATEESVQEAIDSAMLLLRIDLDDRLREFYLCQMLHDVIAAENNDAREIIGRVTAESLSFYDISFINFTRRLDKSRRIGKDLALLYALMPQVEQLEKEYDSHKRQFRVKGQDESVDALCKMLNSNLDSAKENIFTQRIREMLQQEVSEVRAQVNYQLLFFSALLTFLAVIITAVVTLVS